jgi:hypothetical protein
LHLGVRSNRVDVDEVVRAALGDYLVEGVDAPPNFSVIIGGEAAQGDVATGLHFLYMNHTAIVRTRRPERVMECLFAYLARHSAAAEPNGLIRVTGVGLVKEGRAVLAPGMITTWTDLLAPRLNRSGVQYVDAPDVALDVERGDMVVDEPGLVVDRAALAELNRHGSPGREPASVQPGRYPLVGWALFTGDEDQIGPISAANGIVAAAPGMMHRSDMEAEHVIKALGRIFARTKPVAVGSPYKGDLASKLLAVFSG